MCGIQGSPYSELVFNTGLTVYSYPGCQIYFYTASKLYDVIKHLKHKLFCDFILAGSYIKENILFIGFIQNATFPAGTFTIPDNCKTVIFCYKPIQAYVP